MRRGLTVCLAAAVLLALTPGAAQAASGKPAPLGHAFGKGGRQVERRMWLPKHVKVIPSAKTPRSSSSLAPSVTAPPSAVTAITNLSNDASNVYSETAIAANPLNSSQFMVLSNEPTQNYMALFNTTDHGNNWTPSHVTVPSGPVPNPLLAADPSIVFWGSNAAAATFIAADQNFNTSLFFEYGNSLSGSFPQYTQCTGTGVSGNGCVELDGGSNEPDKPMMAIDANNEFYVTYDMNPISSPGQVQPLLFLNDNNSGNWIANRVWDSGGDIGGFISIMPGASPGSAPTIYLSWLDYCGNATFNATQQCPNPSGRLVSVKSTDRGFTFTRMDGTTLDQNCTNLAVCGPTQITSVTTGGGSILPNYGGSCAMGCAPRTITSLPSMDVDHSGGTHNGRLYAVWADGADRQLGTSTVPSTNRMHIFLSSFDPGGSWSAPIQVDTGNTNDAWQPSVAVDQSNGNVVVTWYDRRDDTNNHLYRPYYAQSADGGATWSAQIPLSANMSDPQIDCNGTGDYMQVIAVGGHARPAWTEMSGTTPQVWSGDIDESKVPATATTTTTTSNLRNPSGTSWQQLPGAARDIGIGPDSSCLVSVIGTDSRAGGGGVYVWGGNRWFGPIAGGSGVRITGDPFGLVEVVTRSNSIYELIVNNSGALQWVQLPGSGTDISAAANITLWVIGTNPVGGGGGVWAFNGSNGWVSPYGGGGRRIAVDPSGQPWIINSNHQIFCHNQLGWLQIPGAANDIGVGADGEVWVVGTNPVGGGFGIYRWSDGCDLTGSWSSVPGGGVAISVGTDGLPFIINSAGQIYERMF